MDPNSSPVKPKRRYDSVRRREQARQTREAILDTARRLFLTDGFAPTKVAAIAQEAQDHLLGGAVGVRDQIDASLERDLARFVEQFAQHLQRIPYET